MWTVVKTVDASSRSTARSPRHAAQDQQHHPNSPVRRARPLKLRNSRELLDWEKEFNTGVNKIRYLIEQTIANLKTWRILHTDYRRPLSTFTTTISTVIALHFYAIS